MKDIIIEFLYLDLDTCERCKQTDEALMISLNEAINIISSMGYKITLQKIHMKTPELAVKYRFESSPTIRINGSDMQIGIKENSCGSCSDICGEDVTCRVWTYQGNEYTVPPKDMITAAILKEVNDNKQKKLYLKTKYVMPNNLKKFYKGINNKSCC